MKSRPKKTPASSAKKTSRRPGAVRTRGRARSQPRASAPPKVSAPASPPETFCGGFAPPTPAPQHEWLQRFVGEWDVEVEARMTPDAPPFVSRGTETIRSVGGFWIVAEGRSLTMPYTHLVTLGFDPVRRKYIGAWLDSMTSYLWQYEGAVDEAGRTLTLETEGPTPLSPGRHARYREVTEFESSDHRVFTSSRLEDDGRWTTHLTIHSRRRK